MSDDFQVIKVPGTLFYTYLSKPDSVSKKFSITVGVSQETRKYLESLGYSPSKDKQGNLKAIDGFDGSVYTFKCNPLRQDGSTKVVKVIDKSGNTLNKIIGHGSKGVVATLPFTAKKPTGGIHRGLALFEVLVTDLVEFVGKTPQTSFTADDGLDTTATKAADNAFDL